MNDEKNVKENREFQIEILKVQIKNDVYSSQATLALSLEFSTFISLAVVYVSYGLTSGNQWSIIYGASFLVILIILTNLTMRYFRSKTIEKTIDKNLEEAIKPIRDKFIASTPEPQLTILNQLKEINKQLDAIEKRLEAIETKLEEKET